MGITYFYYRMGISYYEIKDFHMALKYLKKIYKRNNAEKYICKSNLYFVLGSIYERFHNYNTAIKFYDMTIKRYKDFNDKNDEFIACLFYFIGRLYIKLNKYNKALNY